MSLFLHFSSTHEHQILQFYFYLYSEDFYWGVFSYIICTDIYYILFLKHDENVFFFLPVGGIFWFIES